jgi:hypothetical protein
MSVTRAAFVATVLGYCGTPTMHQGRVPGVAMDCPAPAIVACWELGLKPRTFDVTGYGREPDGKVFKALLDEHAEPIPWAQAREADLLLCSYDKDQNRPRHLGVLVDATPGRMFWVHADPKRWSEVRRSRLMFGVDGMRLAQAYRVPGVT